MSRKVIWTDKCNTPGGHYSQGIAYNGILYTSGIVPVKPRTHEVIGESIQAATKQTLDNLSEVAKAAGTSLKNALKVTVFLTDIKDFKEFNEIYSGYFPDDPPARSTVTIAGLLRTRIEIEAIIAIP